MPSKPPRTFADQIAELQSGRYQDIGAKPVKTPRKLITRPAWAARKRIVGGRATEEVRLATLERVRGDTLIHKQRKCAKPGGCKQPAVRDCDFCVHHGGRSLVLARRMSDPSWRPGKYAAMRVVLSRAVSEGTLPPELSQNPTFREILQLACFQNSAPKGMPDQRGHPERTAFFSRRKQARIALNELLVGWAAIQDGDFGPWTRALQNARNMGLIHF
jgi:hypothetical protein